MATQQRGDNDLRARIRCDFIITFPTRHNWLMAKLKISTAGELASDGSRPPQPLKDGPCRKTLPTVDEPMWPFNAKINISKTLIAGVGSLTLVN